jgi:hypothetical protein
MVALTHGSQSFAWKAATFSGPADYSVTLSEAEADELAAAVRGLPVGTAPESIAPDAFALPLLARRMRAARDEVRSGRGFSLLRGLPVDGLSREQFVAAVWIVGQHFGQALSQNAQGERIGHVIDATANDPTPRMYRSNLELRPHNDFTPMISLACWHKGETGGASVVVSGVTVHDQIRDRHPAALATLYRGFHHHRLGEQAEGVSAATPYRTPVFSAVDGALSCRYLRSNMVAGHMEMNAPLTPDEIEALNTFDRVATAPENRLAFFLERGDMLVINNYTVMHARTSFTNHPDPEHKRHLVRLWLDAPGFRAVVPEIHLHAPHNGVPPQPGRRASFDFKKLYANDPVATGGVADLQVSDALAASTLQSTTP